MRIAFTSTGTDWESRIDPRFGRTEFLLVLDEDKNELIKCDNREVNSVAHGAGPSTAQKLFDLSPNVLITGNGPGGNALNALRSFELEIYVGAGGLTIREAYQAYKDKKLQKM